MDRVAGPWTRLIPRSRQRILAERGRRPLEPLNENERHVLALGVGHTVLRQSIRYAPPAPGVGLALH